MAGFASANPIIYCVNSLDESLGWCDLEDRSSNATSVMLGNIPNDVLVMGNNLYVINSGYNTLQEIDRNALQTLREIPLQGCVNPYSVSRIDDQRLAVTGLISNNLAVIELPSGNLTLTRNFGLGLQSVTRHGNRIYVLSTGFAWPNYGDGYLYALDAASYEILDSLFVGTNPQSIAFDSQNRAHVVCTGNYADIAGSVVVLDPSSRTTIATLPLGGTPAAISLGSEYAFIAAGGWAEDGYIYRYRLSDLAILNNASNPMLCGSGASDIVALPNNEFAVSCFMDATIEHRNATGELIHTYLMSAGAGALDAWFGQSSVPRVPQSIADKFQILGAYPNPFNSSTTLQFTAPHLSTSLKIVNILGKEVASLSVLPGQTTFQWSPLSTGGTPLGSGVYLATPGEHSNSQPILLYYMK